MTPLSERWLSFLAGMGVSLLLTASYLPVWTVKPYTKVEVLEETWTDLGLTIRAVFTKNDQCKLVDFSVVAFTDGIPRYVQFEDLDGLEENHDREAGRHGLNILVLTEQDKQDFIELRTRHKCAAGKEGEDTIVTKVFSTHGTT